MIRKSKRLRKVKYQTKPIEVSGDLISLINQYKRIAKIDKPVVIYVEDLNIIS